MAIHKSLTRLLAVITTLLIQQISCSSTNLKAHLSSANLPTILTYFSTSYDGADCIYIFGGCREEEVGPARYSNEILCYSISNDSISLVATLPLGVFDGAVVKTTPDTFLYFGGYKRIDTGVRNISFFEFTPSNASIRTPGVMPYLPAAGWQVNEQSIFLTGGFNLYKFDTWSSSTTELERILPGFSGTISLYDEQEEIAYITGAGSFSQYEHQPVLKYVPRRDERNMMDLGFPRLIKASSGAIDSDKRVAYLVGGFQPSNSIFKFNLDTQQGEYLLVDDFPGFNDTIFYSTKVEYVPKLNRLYFFGGQTNLTTFLKNIWYIDLPGSVFNCANKTDGMYAHPVFCERFINCRGEEMTEFSCPRPLKFDPVATNCNVPERVTCELECSSRSDGLYPHPKNCGKFVICRYSVTKVYDCPEPLLFDPVGLRCQDPQLVECGQE